MRSSQHFLTPASSRGARRCDRTSRPTCVFDVKMRPHKLFLPASGSRNHSFVTDLSLLPTDPGCVLRLLCPIHAGQSGTELHSSARHCHRLPSSPLIENASEHLSRTNHLAPRQFRSRLTTTRPSGSRVGERFSDLHQLRLFRCDKSWRSWCVFQKGTVCCKGRSCDELPTRMTYFPGASFQESEASS